MGISALVFRHLSPLWGLPQGLCALYIIDVKHITFILNVYTKLLLLGIASSLGVNRACRIPRGLQMVIKQVSQKNPPWGSFWKDVKSPKKDVRSSEPWGVHILSLGDLTSFWSEPQDRFSVKLAPWPSVDALEFYKPALEFYKPALEFYKPDWHQGYLLSQEVVIMYRHWV